MPETFVALLAAHLLSDFVFQNDWIVKNKTKSWVLALHTAIVALASLLAIGAWARQAAWAIFAILITHLAMDWLKTNWLGNTLRSFVGDQAFHLAVIAAVALLCPDLAAQGWWGTMPGDAQSRYYAGLALLSGIIVAIPLSGILIKLLTEPLVPKKPGGGAISGMAKGGRYIGWLERGLAFLFILMKQPEGVGFLLAAKSILRFGDITNSKERAQAEYIIIGTFLSFGCGLLAALATAWAMRHWAS